MIVNRDEFLRMMAEAWDREVELRRGSPIEERSPAKERNSEDDEYHPNTVATFERRMEDVIRTIKYYNSRIDTLTRNFLEDHKQTASSIDRVNSLPVVPSKEFRDVNSELQRDISYLS
jgi:hypothetical protein